MRTKTNCPECGVVARYGHTLTCSKYLNRNKALPTLKIDRHVFRVAVVWAASEPGKKTLWAASGEEEMRRVETHKLFVRWVTEDVLFSENGMREIPKGVSK